MKQYIETPPLLLRDWKEADILPFARLNSDDRAMEYFLKNYRIKKLLIFTIVYKKSLRRMALDYMWLKRQACTL